MLYDFFYFNFNICNNFENKNKKWLIFYLIAISDNLNLTTDGVIYTQHAIKLLKRPFNTNKTAAIVKTITLKK